MQVILAPARKTSIRLPYKTGGVAERFNAAVLKTVVGASLP